MKDLERVYLKLQLVRKVEEEIARIYPSDKIKSPVHLSIGQEAVSVGVCDVLRHDDVIAPTYRCHAAYLAKGGDLRGMMAELFGKVAGSARGKGGSMHLIDADHHVLGASAVVGTTIPIAVGYSLALKREGKRRVAVVFFGDGGTEEGVFHESLNFAALQKLPVLFVCENNFYAIHTPIEKRWATRRLCERVSTYGIPTNLIDDNDVMQIRGVCGERVAAMREGSGPAFVEIHTYRWREHVGPGEDYNAGYRGLEELRKWQEKDQVALVGQQIDPEVRKRIDSEVDASIRDAVEFAENAAWPAPEELLKHVFAE